jgi:RHS repeat-associated protein
MVITTLLRILRSRVYATTSLMACVLVAVSVTASAQAPSRPDRGIRPVGSYSVSDIENISLTNGNVNVSIPLAGLPPKSGGDLSWTISAIYNSKTWDMVRDERRIPLGPTYVVDSLQESDAGKWRIGGAYGITFRESRADFDWEDPVPGDPDEGILINQHNWYKVLLSTPDGAEHELRPLGVSGFPGTRDYLRGYYGTIPGTNGNPMVYYSFDGSFLWAVIYPDNVNYNRRWEIYLPNGTKVVQRRDNAGVQRITDTNGNRIEIVTTEDSPGVLTTHYRDQETDREVQLVVSTSGTQARYQTVGEDEWVTIQLAYGFTTVKGKTFPITDDNGLGGTCERRTVLPETPLYVLRSITLPATEPGPARQYVFSYSSDLPFATVSLPYQDFCGQTPQTVTSASRGWGSLSQIAMPSGAAINYSYDSDSMHALISADNATKETITTKTVVHDGTTDVWNYGINEIGGSVSNPDGTGVAERKYPQSPGLPGYLGGFDGRAGLVYRTTTADKIIERRWTTLMFSGGDNSAAGGLVTFNPVVETEYTTLLNSAGQPSKMSARTFQYDFNGNVTQETHYDWISPSVSRDAEGVPLPGINLGTALRVTTNTYYNPAGTASSGNVYAKRSNTDPPAPLILNAPRTTVVGASQTEFYYDNNSSLSTPPSEGNLTKERRWEGTKWIETTHGYDSFGNGTSTTDPNGNTTTIVYDSATHAQPISVTVDPDSQVTGDELITTTEYDFATGLVTSMTDANGNTTTYNYNNLLLSTPTLQVKDPFGRPGTVTDPLNRKTQTRYHDSTRKVQVWSDLSSTDDAKLRTQTSVDMLGRPTKTESSEDGITYSISSDTVYHVADRTTFVSNPHRAASQPTDGWTRTTWDTAGRVVEVANFSGADLPANTGTSGSTGVVTTTYNAHETTVTDQAGKKRRSVIDGLGRLVRVDEPDASSGNLDQPPPNQTTPVQSTSYSYDALGNLTQVVQGGQTRTFIYDALSRLKTATNPENLAINYTYFDNNNLLTKTDARNVVTTYGYDGLNRVKTRLYSGPSPGGATPGVTYTYDAAGVPNSKGRLTSVSSSVSTYSYTNFDAAGRVLACTQSTGGQPYNMSYQYNLAGGMTHETYPSGKEVVTEYDNAGRVAGVKKDATIYYAGGGPTSGLITYTPHGAIKTLKMGNNLVEHTNFNSRLQPEQIGLGASDTDFSKLRLNYGYGTGTTNNGNVLSQRIRISGSSPLDVTTNYTYDELNRLKSATESIGSVAQTYDYDRWGNRAVRTGSYIPNPALTPISNSTGDNLSTLFNQTNNRIAISGYGYDLAGNLKQDPVTGSNPLNGMTYDAENRQVSYSRVGGGGATEYFYDGDGRRVKKVDNSVASSVTSVFVYNVAGQLIAEYTNSTSPPTGGGGTSYLTTDHLGSTRVVTRADGSVKARYDYLPFGEDLGSGVGPRTGAMGYGGGDQTRQKFTQKERDSESGLDYFLARYYSSAQGRFTSPDEFTGGPNELYYFAEDASYNPTFYADLYAPQSLNKYQYGLNNPLRYVDPDGHQTLRKTGSVPVPLPIMPYKDAKALADATHQALIATGDAIIAVGKFIIENGNVEGPEAHAARNMARIWAKQEGQPNQEGQLSHAEAKRQDEANLQAQGQGQGREGKDFTPAGKREIDAKSGGNCVDCGRPTRPVKSERGVPTPEDQRQRHHEKPKSQGGSGTPDNGVVVCPACHKERHVKLRGENLQ